MKEETVADPEKKTYPYKLFEVLGLELEYMIVDKKSLNVLPITDQLMFAMTGSYLDDLSKDPISWSNELALHVLEFKTTDPVKNLGGLDLLFLKEVQEANRYLDAFGARLMPTAMHPWMDPFKEMRLWPHAYNAIYAAFNKIFDCRGHGWANLQSAHINLPFSNDEEFARLHATIRVVLPLIPGLAASSPLADGKVTGHKDTRLCVYRVNSQRIANITGHIIPEVVSSEEEYEQKILQPMYRDIAPYDPEKILQFEWLNARGAIARFDRGSIEIRLIDVQETPKADVAIAYAVLQVVRALADERWATLAELNALNEVELKAILIEGNTCAEEAKIEHQDFLRALGWKGTAPCTQRELWGHLIDSCCDKNKKPEYCAVLDVILKQGTLATRMLKALGTDPNNHQNQYQMGLQLCEALQQGHLFLP